MEKTNRNIVIFFDRSYVHQKNKAVLLVAKNNEEIKEELQKKLKMKQPQIETITCIDSERAKSAMNDYSIISAWIDPVLKGNPSEEEMTDDDQGIGLLKHIREEYPAIPIYMVSYTSADISDTVGELCIDNGATALLNSDVNIAATITRSVEQYLEIYDILVKQVGIIGDSNAAEQLRREIYLAALDKKITDGEYQKDIDKIVAQWKNANYQK